MRQKEKDDIGKGRRMGKRMKESRNKERRRSERR